MPAQLRIPAKSGNREYRANPDVLAMQNRAAITSHPFQKLDARSSVNYLDIDGDVDNIDRRTKKSSLHYSHVLLLFYALFSYLITELLHCQSNNVLSLLKSQDFSSQHTIHYCRSKYRRKKTTKRESRKRKRDMCIESSEDQGGGEDARVQGF